MPIVLLLILALLGIALLLGGAAYEAVVMAPNYEREIPASVDTARAFFQARTPAHYFRVLSPVTQLLLLASTLVGWKTPGTRWSAGAVLIVLILLDAITFLFHYPRLKIMFKTTEPVEAERLRRAAREWTQGNLVRVALLAAAFLGALNALMIAYS